MNEDFGCLHALEAPWQLTGSSAIANRMGRIGFRKIQAVHTTRDAQARICGTTCKREEQLAHSE
jgi:hypothetical protein